MRRAASEFTELFTPRSAVRFRTFTDSTFAPSETFFNVARTWPNKMDSSNMLSGGCLGALFL